MPPKVAPLAARGSGCHSGHHTIYLHPPTQVPARAKLPGQRLAPPPAFREATVREGKACSRSSTSPQKTIDKKQEVHPNWEHRLCLNLRLSGHLSSELTCESTAHRMGNFPLKIQ